MDDAYDIIAAGLAASAGGLTSTGYAGAVAARTGVGEYTLTLAQAAPVGECQVHITPSSFAGNAPEVIHTSDLVKRVRTSQAGAPADSAFNFVIVRSYKR